MDKCAIFIDGAYMAKVTSHKDRNGRKIRISFEKLIDRLSEGTELVGAYYYVSMPYRGERPSPYENDRYRLMETFLYNLRQVPKMTVKMGQMIRDENGKETQKGVDMMLGIDIAKMCWKQEIRKAIIVASDGDFVPAIRCAREENVLTHLYHYGDRGICRTNKLLINECGRETVISDDLLDECRLEIPAAAESSDATKS